VKTRGARQIPKERRRELLKRRKNIRETDLRFPVGEVTAKPVYIPTRKPKALCLQRIREYVIKSNALLKSI
jgi:hypothetical protein